MQRLLTILVDDCRDSGADIICRNGETALRVLREFWGEIDFLMLDHDLGERSATGYDILCWMEQTFHEPSKWPCEIQLVTMNPVGRDNMARVLKKCFYTAKHPRHFVRSDLVGERT